MESHCVLTFCKVISQDGTKKNVSLVWPGLESLWKIKPQSPLSCVYNDRNTRLIFNSPVHIHTTFCLLSSINRSTGEHKEKNQIQSGHWFEGVFWNGGVECVCSFVCVFSLNTMSTLTFVETTLQVPLFKDPSAAPVAAAGEPFFLLQSSSSPVLRAPVWLRQKMTWYQHYHKTSRWELHL